VYRKPRPFDLLTESLNVGRNGCADIPPHERSAEPTKMDFTQIILLILLILLIILAALIYWFGRGRWW